MKYEKCIFSSFRTLCGIFFAPETSIHNNVEKLLKDQNFFHGHIRVQHVKILSYT